MCVLLLSEKEALKPRIWLSFAIGVVYVTMQGSCIRVCRPSCVWLLRRLAVA